jgi:hypothetical protein
MSMKIKAYFSLTNGCSGTGLTAGGCSVGYPITGIEIGMRHPGNQRGNSKRRYWINQFLR